MEPPSRGLLGSKLLSYCAPNSGSVSVRCAQFQCCLAGVRRVYVCVCVRGGGEILNSVVDKNIQK